MSVAELERTKTYFEEFVAWAPEPFKGLARTVTDVLAWPLELVAGDPDDLMRAAAECVSIGEALRGVADQHGAPRGPLASNKPSTRFAVVAPASPAAVHPETTAGVRD